MFNSRNGAYFSTPVNTPTPPPAAFNSASGAFVTLPTNGAAPAGAFNSAAGAYLAAPVGAQPSSAVNSPRGAYFTTPGPAAASSQPFITGTTATNLGLAAGAGVNIGTANAGASGTVPGGGIPQVNGPGGSAAAVSRASMTNRPSYTQSLSNWRLVNQKGQWWYWSPGNYWMYYRSGAWQRYNPDLSLVPAQQANPQ
jgi:hypothetical protein